MEVRTSLSLQDVDCVRKIKLALEPIVKEYSVHENTLRVQVFALKAWPLTKAICDRLKFKLPDDTTEPKGYQGQSWNRRVWTTLFQVATAVKTTINKRGANKAGKISRPPKRESEDNEESGPNPSKPKLEVANSPAQKSSRSILRTSASTLASRSQSPALPMRPSPQPQMRQNTNLAPIPEATAAQIHPPVAFSSPWLVVFVVDNGERNYLLIERVASFMPPGSKVVDISLITHERVRDKGRNSGHALAKEVNWDVLFLELPDNIHYHCRPSVYPDGDLVGFLASVAFQNGRSPIEFAVSTLTLSEAASSAEIPVQSTEHDYLEDAHKERLGFEEDLQDLDAQPSRASGEDMTSPNLSASEGNLDRMHLDAGNDTATTSEENFGPLPLDAGNIESDAESDNPAATATTKDNDTTTDTQDTSKNDNDPNATIPEDSDPNTTTQDDNDPNADMQDDNDPNDTMPDDSDPNATILDDSEDLDEDIIVMEHNIINNILEDPESLLDGSDTALSTMQATLQAQVASSLNSSRRFEHLGPEVAEALDAFGLTKDTYESWLPHQFNSSINGKPWAVKLHQIVACVFDLKCAERHLAVLNADEQGLGKTLQVLLYALCRHLIAVMVKHYRDKNTHEEHARDAQGKCQFAIKARRRWWPFAYCVCEKKCPNFIRVSLQPPEGITLVIAPNTIIWANEYAKCFNPTFDPVYTLSPIIFHNKIPMKFKHWSYKSNLNKDAVSKLHFDKKEGPSAPLTRYLCITTHHSSYKLTKDQLLKHYWYHDRVKNGRTWNRVYKVKVNTEKVTTAVDSIVYDECHMTKRPDTMLWKFIQEMLHASYSPTVLMPLSGTPHAEGLDDLEAIVGAWQISWGIMQLTGRRMHSSEAVDATKKLMAELTVERLALWRTNFNVAASTLQRLAKGLPTESKDIVTKLLGSTDAISESMVPVYRGRTSDSILFGKPLLTLPPFKQIDKVATLTGNAVDLIKGVNSRVQAMVEELVSSKKKDKVTANRIMSNLQNMRPYGVFPGIDVIRKDSEYNVSWALDNPHVHADVVRFQQNEPISFQHLLDKLWATSDRARLMSDGFNKKLSEYEDLHARDPKPEDRPPKLLAATASPITALAIAAVLREKNPTWNICLYTSNLNQVEREAIRERFEEAPGTDDHGLPVPRHHEPVNVIIGTTTILAVGHTFLRATDMYLMELQNNAASERQFYKRSHRIGQTKVVTCTRFTNTQEIPWEANISTRAHIKQFISNRVTDNDMTKGDAAEDDEPEA